MVGLGIRRGDARLEIARYGPLLRREGKIYIVVKILTGVFNQFVGGIECNISILARLSAARKGRPRSRVPLDRGRELHLLQFGFFKSSIRGIRGHHYDLVAARPQYGIFPVRTLLAQRRARRGCRRGGKGHLNKAVRSVGRLRGLGHKVILAARRRQQRQQRACQ